MHVTLYFLIDMWTKRPFEGVQLMTLVIRAQAVRIRYGPIKWVIVALRSRTCYHTLREVLDLPQTPKHSDETD